MPQTLNLLKRFIQKKNDLNIEEFSTLPNKLVELINTYNVKVHRNLNNLSKTPNFSGEDVQIFYGHLD